MLDKQLHSNLGSIFTKRFLRAKYVKMISEGDFVTRVRILVKCVYVLISYSLWFSFYFYFRYIVGKQGEQMHAAQPQYDYLFDQQIMVLNSFMFINIYHLVMVISTMIIMLNMTMGKGTTIFTTFFNILYLCESLFFASVLYVWDAVGVFDWIKTGEVWKILSTQWLWIFVWIIALFSFFPMTFIFKQINAWNREWIRVSKYRNMKDKENAFVFKTWVAPGEIKARKLMISAAWFIILASGIMHILDIFNLTDFTTIKYTILIFGYIVFVASYVIPYNKISLLFYWISHIFILSIFIYALYIIQTQAWQSNKWFQYGYFCLLIPWALSLSSACKYTWTIKDKEEIKAIVVNEFETEDDFEEFVDKQTEQSKEIIEEKELNI